MCRVYVQYPVTDHRVSLRLLPVLTPRVPLPFLLVLDPRVLVWLLLVVVPRVLVWLLPVGHRDLRVRQLIVLTSTLCV